MKRRVPLSPKTAALLLLLAAAVWLRWWGLDWGLPQTFNSDEPHIVNTALAYAGSFPRPFDFKYPALWPTILFFAYGLYFLLWSGLGLLHKVGDFIALFGWNPGGFYLIGRVLSALLSLAAAAAIARHEKAVRGRVFPWAAIALAFSPFIVDAAHSCKPDCLMLFWASLAWLAALEVFDGERKAHWLCGAFTGLAVSTQYTAAPLAGLLAAANLFSRKRRLAWLLEGLGAMALTFLATSPYTVIDLPRFLAELEDFAALAAQTPYDAVSMRIQVALNYWRFAGPGSIAGLLALLGVLRMFAKDRRLAGVFLIPLALQWLAVSRYPDGTWPRYLFAAFPGLALLCAEAMDWVEGARRPLLTLLIAVLAFAPGLLRSAFTDALISLPDTRPQAQAWLEANVPPGASVLLDLPHASPALRMDKDELVELERKTREAGSPRARLYAAMVQAHPGGGYRVYRIRRGASEMYSLPSAVARSQADALTVDARPGLDTLRALRIGWVVTSSWGADPSRVPELRAYFDELYAQAAFVKDFLPAPGERAGPVLRVFKLK